MSFLFKKGRSSICMRKKWKTLNYLLPLNGFLWRGETLKSHLLQHPMEKFSEVSREIQQTSRGYLEDIRWAMEGSCRDGWSENIMCFLISIRELRSPPLKLPTKHWVKGSPGKTTRQPCNSQGILIRCQATSALVRNGGNRHSAPMILEP